MFVIHTDHHDSQAGVEKDNSDLKEFKKTLLKNKEYDFVLLFNSRDSNYLTSFGWSRARKITSQSTPGIPSLLGSLR